MDKQYALGWYEDKVKQQATEIERLQTINKDLLEALNLARKCIGYCRRAHQDPQSEDGIPVELFIDETIAKATRESS